MTKLSNAEGRALFAALGNKRKFKGARLTRQELVAANPALAAKIIFGDEPAPVEKPKKKPKAPPAFTPEPRGIRPGIFIPFNTPSSKNSKRWTGAKLINSELVMWYKKYTLGFWIMNKVQFLNMIRGKEYPLKLQFHYIRDKKKDFDCNNASQIVQDLMVEHGWLPDDNMRYMKPQEPSYEVGDKFCCGVWINVL